MINIIAAFLVSLSVSASVRLDLTVKSSDIATGEMISSVLYLKISESESLNVGLKGIKFEETLYIHSVSPFFTSSSSDTLQADVKVIFLKQPEKKRLESKVGEQNIEINLPDLVLKQTDAKEFEYGEFSVPEKFEILIWLVGLVLILPLIIYFRKIIVRSKKQKQKIRSQNELKDKLVSAKHYEEIVEIWKKKHTYLNEFPDLEEIFCTFEKVLFKVQFKPCPTEEEKTEVKAAYSSFSAEISRRENGI